MGLLLIAFSMQEYEPWGTQRSKANTRDFTCRTHAGMYLSPGSTAHTHASIQHRHECTHMCTHTHPSAVSLWKFWKPTHRLFTVLFFVCIFTKANALVDKHSVACDGERLFSVILRDL